MCRQVTPKDKHFPCGRCGNVANPTDGWEHAWPLRGTLEIGFPSQIFVPLFGQYDGSGEFWQQSHPVIKKFDAQNVIIQWEGDNTYNDKTGVANYRLCYECQKQLLQVIGQFFKFNEFHQKRVSNDLSS